MNKIALAAIAVAASGVAACQQTSHSNGSTTIEVNGQKTEQIVNEVKERARDAGNVVRNVSGDVANELRPYGNAIGNGAKAAWNEVREETRGDGNKQ